jgi:hypothetical protein
MGCKSNEDGNNKDRGGSGEKKMEEDIRSGRSEESVFLLSCVSDVLEASIRVLISAINHRVYPSFNPPYRLFKVKYPIDLTGSNEPRPKRLYRADNYLKRPIGLI